MKLITILSVLAFAGSALALPSPLEQRQDNCIDPILCCGTLTTPLDPIVDPILLGLGINAAEIVGSIGILCHPYSDSCATEPLCCTEANLLGGVLALGCSPKHHH